MADDDEDAWLSAGGAISEVPNPTFGRWLPCFAAVNPFRRGLPTCWQSLSIQRAMAIYISS